MKEHHWVGDGNWYSCLYCHFGAGGPNYNPVCPKAPDTLPRMTPYQRDILLLADEYRAATAWYVTMDGRFGDLTIALAKAKAKLLDAIENGPP